MGEKFYNIGNMKPPYVAELGTDSEANIVDLPAYAKRMHFSPGSTCLVRETSSVYELGSDGTWAKL